MTKRVISFFYHLKNRNGDTIDASGEGEAMAFLEGGGQIIPALEKVLAGMNVGEKRESVEIAARDAYGEHDETLIVKVSRSQLPKEDIKVGDVFTGNDGHHTQIVKVKEISANEVTLDANHPLAGVDLFFDVEVADIRPATAEELSHGHVHGPGGAHDH